MLQEANKEWIDNNDVFQALMNKEKSFFDGIGSQICVSENYDFCLFFRSQNAWYIESQGWRDTNESPKDNKRLILNFYKIDRDKNEKSWFKIFVPLEYEKDCVLKSIDNGKYKIINPKKLELVGKFKNFDTLMWKLISGNAEREFEIKNKFNKIEI